MSWVEVAGFATGALCVWLVVREHIGNFPVGIANNVFFIVLFVQAGLYADVGLQVVYIGLGLYGWYWWLHGGQDRGPLTVSRVPLREGLVVAAAVVAGTALVTYLLATRTDSTVPLADALTTCLSLAAQYLLTRKYLENWYVWITADVLFIGLFTHKELYLTAVLYAGFLVLCCLGLRAWRRSERAAALVVVEPGPAVAVP